MSVLIKGMEMPTNCFLCPLSVLNGKRLFCEVTKDEVLRERTPRYCPLVPVPPHGRLIDADALYREIKAECNPYGKPSIGYDDGLKVLGIIGSTPPVIPAEPPKDEAPAGPYDLLYEEGGAGTT
jgi:hypothetical protein